MSAKKGECCYKCRRRRAGCSAACPEYAAEREERLKLYEKRSRDVDITSASIELKKRRFREK